MYCHSQATEWHSENIWIKVNISAKGPLSAPVRSDYLWIYSNDKTHCNFTGLGKIWIFFVCVCVGWIITVYQWIDNKQMTSLYYLHFCHTQWFYPVIGQISSLQATQMTQEAAIRDLDNERSRLKDKVLRIEEEREALQSQNQALEERQKQQILSLDKVCILALLCFIFMSGWNNCVMNNQSSSSHQDAATELFFRLCSRRVYHL